MQATINLKLGRGEDQATITTDHEAASHGQPVVVYQGQALGIDDIISLPLPAGWRGEERGTVGEAIWDKAQTVWRARETYGENYDQATMPLDAVLAERMVAPHAARLADAMQM